jgi:predicted RNA methylase
MTAKMYQHVNEVIEGAGGKWDKSVQAHVFPRDAAEALAPVLATGTVVTLREKRQDSQFFPTPAPVVARLLELAELAPGMEALEPSAGSGAIATALGAAGAAVDCIERDPGYAATLLEAGTARTVRTADFLAVPPQPRYDRVAMNPPFTRGTDIAHVEHALRFLKPDGLLVSVMSWSVTYETRKTAPFRNLVEHRGGTVEAVASGAFAKSGTGVDTVIVTIPATKRTGTPPVVWPQREIPEQPEPEHRSPLEILHEIRDNMREADAIFADLERMLTEPVKAVRPAKVIELPAPRQEQLSLDMGEAS